MQRNLSDLDFRAGRSATSRSSWDEAPLDSLADDHFGVSLNVSIKD